MARPIGIPLSVEHRAKLIASNSGQRTHRLPKEKRICELCVTEYQPNGSKQRWCSTCAPNNTFKSRCSLYGVSKTIWDRMLFEQNGKCSLCEKEPKVVDHDHETNVVRGLLCSACNIALNRVETIGWIDRAQAHVLKGKI